MDNFIEQIVRCRFGSREHIVSALIFVAAVVLACGALFLSAFVPILLSVILCIGVFYGAWYLWRGQFRECEYCIVNGDMDIDLIIAQRKRRRLVSVHCNKIESAMPYAPEKFAARTFDRTVMAASAPDAEGVWAFTYHSKKNGHTLVLFQPNERVLEMFLDSLSRPLQLEVRRNAGL